MWLNSLTITTHYSMKVNIKTIFFIPNVYFISSLFYLLSPLRFSLILFSLTTQTLSLATQTLSFATQILSLLFLILPLSLILVSLCQMLRWWCNKAWLHSVWAPIAGISRFWWFGFSGCHKSHFLFSFLFSLFFFHRLAFFHPKRKTLRFWVWV